MAAWAAAARSRRSASLVRSCGEAGGGGLEAGEGEVAARAAEQGAGQGEAFGVAALRQALQRRAGRIGEAERAADLVERLAGRVVDGRAQPAAGADRRATSSSWQWPPDTSSSRKG